MNREDLMHVPARIVASIALAGSLLGGASAAFADAAVISSFPAAGTAFVCQNATYTATAGSIKFVMQMGTSASGNFHVTGTATPDGVVLQDTTGSVYRLVGASWFGANSNSQTGGQVMGSTDEFQIISQGGGTVARVQQMFHVDSKGQVTIDKSTCQPPL